MVLKNDGGMFFSRFSVFYSLDRKEFCLNDVTLHDETMQTCLSFHDKTKRIFNQNRNIFFFTEIAQKFHKKYSVSNQTDKHSGSKEISKTNKK